MSAFLVTQTHIRAIVSAAGWDHYDQVPFPPRAIIEEHPAAFAFLRSGSITERGWAKFCHDELGRALWLANAMSLKARYPTDWEDMLPDGGLATILGYRHAFVELAPAAVIKLVDCFNYQACEVSDYETTWAAKATQAIREAAIHKLPGYDATPWGLDDPEDGPPQPGTAGAPVSLLSLMRR
jgi:hypothetical protein